MQAQQTCEERILDHLNGRVADFGALRDLASAYDVTTLAEALEDSATRDLFAELIYDCAARELTDADTIAAMTPEALEAALDTISLDAVQERAQTRMDEMPLAVSASTVFRVDLSTGGPADWLEVFCSGNTPRYDDGAESFEVERIVYHFADWFDHAERELEGFELEAAEAFVSRVVPELID